MFKANSNEMGENMNRKARGKGEGATSVDAEVGRRLRELRMLAGLSQSDLAATIGLTFQQLQKYERGVNRISASKLYLLARHLSVPVSAFFVDIDSQRDTEEVSVGGNVGSAAGEEALFRSREALVLARNFLRIRDAAARDALKAFVESCATLPAGKAVEEPAGASRRRQARDPVVAAAASSRGARRGRRPRSAVWHPSDVALA